jgi:membrane dipeptidase
MRIPFFLVVLPFLAACASTGTPAPTPAAPPQEDVVSRARAIHGRVLKIDTHDDIPFNFATPEYNPCKELNRQVDVPKMRAGGLDAAFFAVFVGQTPRTPEGYEKAKQDAMTKFNAIHRMTEMCPDQIEFAYTPDDVERIHKSGKLVATIGIENGYVIGKDLSLLKKYHDLGAHYITLAHGGHNDIADSSTPREGEPAEENHGISAFGEQVIAEMNRLGIMVDVSHISKKAMLDAVRLSKAPVIASHSSTSALANVPRNMDDEQLLALKKNGGVIQMVALDGFVKVPNLLKQSSIAKIRKELGLTGGGGGGLNALTPEHRAQYDRQVAELDKHWPRATVSDFVDHIDHAVRLIGIEHVGISSDFDGGGGIVGWNNAAETFNVTLELVRRGYSEDDIRKLWGGNLMRVWRAAEQQARASAVTS